MNMSALSKGQYSKIGSALQTVLQTHMPCNYFYKNHPEREIFQAIRIEVNHELDVIEPALEQALSILNIHGNF